MADWKAEPVLPPMPALPPSWAAGREVGRRGATFRTARAECYLGPPDRTAREEWRRARVYRTGVVDYIYFFTLFGFTKSVGKNAIVFVDVKKYFEPCTMKKEITYIEVKLLTTNTF